MKNGNFFEWIVMWTMKPGKTRTIRAAIVALVCVTVFATTYSMILPALTLEKQEASDMSGIDLEGKRPGTAVAATFQPNCDLICSNVLPAR